MTRNIIGDAALFVGAAALIACSSAGPEEGDGCSTPKTGGLQVVCNGDDEVLECKEGQYRRHVPDKNGVSCSCPAGDDTRNASCMSAGFVGIARSDRARARGVALRRRQGA